MDCLRGCTQRRGGTEGISNAVMRRHRVQDDFPAAHQGDDADDEADEDHTDLYAVLNVPRDCSEEDVQRAYRSLAKTFHPDKHQDESLQQAASQSFNRLNEAYSILSDPGKREVYDIYGMEGLKSGLEVGSTVNSREDLREQWENFRAKEKRKLTEQNVNYSGACVLALNGEDLGHGQLPRMTTANMLSTVEAPLTNKDIVTVGGQIVTKARVGGGGCFVFGYHRDFSPHSSLDINAWAGLRQVLQGTVTRQLSTHSSASLTASWTPRHGLGMEVSTSRQLTERISGDLSWVLGPAGSDGMSLTLRRQGEKSDVNGTVYVGAQTGITCSVVRSLDKKTAVRLGIKLGTMGLEGELGATRRAGRYGNVGLSVTVGIQGVIFKLRLSRGGQKFVFPMMIYSHFDWRVALASTVLPPLGIYVVKRYIVKPALQSYRRREEQAMRAESLQVIQAGLARAAAEKRLLEPVAKRRTRQEIEKGGLVVVEAVYGTEAAIDAWPESSISGEPGQGDQSQQRVLDGHELLCALDTTDAVRFLVEGSRLVIHQGVSKTGLMGFCDVSPGRSKELRITYLIDGMPCRVRLGDHQGCHLPSGGTPISDEEVAAAVLRQAEQLQLLRPSLSQG